MPARALARTLTLVALYGAAVLVGRATRLDGTATALVWPAAGVGLLWLAAGWHRRAWRWLDVVLMLAVTVAGNRTTGATMWLSLAFGVANTGQAVAACAALAHLARRRSRVGDVGDLVVLAAAVLGSAGVGAALGPAVLAVAGHGPWPVDAPVWILRNGVSAFVIAAAGFVVVDARRAERRMPPRVVEFIVFCLAAAAIDFLVFNDTAGVPIAFAIVPVSVWVGLRYDVVLAGVQNLLTWGVVVGCTLADHGPFAGRPVDEQVMLAQALTAIVAFLALALAIAREQERRAGAALRRERDFSAAVIDNAEALVVVVDRAGTIVRFNGACERASGLLAGAVLGTRLLEAPFLHEPQRVRLRAALDRVRPGAELDILDDCWHHVDGSVREITWSARQLLDDDGQTEFIVSAGVDVTAERVAERALATSERRYREVVEAARDVVFVLDLEGRLTYIAPQWTAATGFTVQESLGRPLRELVHPEDRALAAAAISALATGELAVARDQGRLLTAQGDVRWVTAQLHPKRDDAGETIGLIGTLRDVTEERELERRLEDERAFVAAIVEQLSNGLLICDEHGRLRSFDAERRVLHPAPTAGVTPERWAELFRAHTPDGARMLRMEELPLHRALRGERVEATEVLVRPEDDSPARSFMITASPITDGEGVNRGALAHVTDVTSLRHAEEDARRHAEDLAAVGEVAHQLASETDLAHARQVICAAARQTAGAAMTMLFQPHPDGRRLVCTATDNYANGIELAVPFTGRPSGTTIAYASGQPFFVARVIGHPAVHREIIEATGVRSAIWQPVIKDGHAIAVLAVGWHEELDEMPPRVAAMLELLAAEAAVAIDRSALIAQLDGIARTDPLTGAHNRRALDERLVEEQARARRSGDELCLAMIDLDHFKRYNDAHGHQQGDRLLKEAVSAWLGEVRVTDTVARYGGEEFAIVLPACALADAQPLADRVRQAVPSAQTCSIGLAQWDGEESVEDLIARADAALYRAKQQGRNRVTVADRGHGAAPLSAGAHENVSQMVLRTARRLLGMDLAFLAEIDGDRLVFRDLEGDRAAFDLDVDDSIPMADSFCQRMLDGRTDGRVPDAAADPEHATLPVTIDAGIGAYIGAPVQLADGRVLGTLCGLRSTAAPTMTEQDLELVRGLAQVVARHFESQLAGDTDPASVAAAWERTVERVAGER
jgi:diguanylate cyclase (GGDEF)-like protein/PAS domain S-box-containing protein